MLIFFGLPLNVLAAPLVNSVSGSFIHGQNITISGSGFGAKNPAAPLMWDDAEDRTVNDESSVLNKGWVDPWPRAGVSSLEHRIKYRNVGYRNVAGPNARSTKFLSGGHYQTVNNNPPYIGTGAEDYRNVSITADAGSGKSRWYASFDYRIDPLWDYGGSSYLTCLNHKITVVQDAGASYTGNFEYNVFRGGVSSPDYGGVSTYMLAGNLGCSMGTWPTNFPALNNPKNQWVKIEQITASDAALGIMDFYIDNVKGVGFLSNCPNWWANKYPASGGLRSYTIGGYWRTCANISDTSTYRGGVNNFRYYDDMYVDGSLSRIILANNQNYSSATIIEPQIPSAWSDGYLTAKVNLGKLPDSGTAYLFVFDSNNQANSIGYPVTLGSSGGDTTPPAPPTGVTVS